MENNYKRFSVMILKHGENVPMWFTFDRYEDAKQRSLIAIKFPFVRKVVIKDNDGEMDDEILP